MCSSADPSAHYIHTNDCPKTGTEYEGGYYSADKFGVTLMYSKKEYLETNCCDVIDNECNHSKEMIHIFCKTFNIIVFINSNHQSSYV